MVAPPQGSVPNQVYPQPVYQSNVVAPPEKKKKDKKDKKKKSKGGSSSDEHFAETVIIHEHIHHEHVHHVNHTCK